MAGLRDDENDLIEFAKGGAPKEYDSDTTSYIDVAIAKGGGPLLPPYPHGYGGSFGQAHRDAISPSGGKTSVESATVTPFKPRVEPSLQDEILQMLDELAASIRDGKVTPSHLILGWSETADGGGASYIWDADGLTRFELIGHLYSYATKLANGEGT